jgi:hypothetical protein
MFSILFFCTVYVLICCAVFYYNTLCESEWIFVAFGLLAIISTDNFLGKIEHFTSSLKAVLFAVLRDVFRGTGVSVAHSVLQLRDFRVVLYVT